MDKKEIKKIQEIFKKYSKIKLAYFFDPNSIGYFNTGSNCDFALYIKEKDIIKTFNIRSKLMNEISRIIKNDNVNIIVLNEIDDPTLKFEIIREGTLIYEVEPYRVLVPPQILNEYEDFILTFRRNQYDKYKEIY